MSACGHLVHYDGRIYACSLPEGHTGPHRTWVEDAETDDEPRLWREPDDTDSGYMGRL